MNKPARDDYGTLDWLIERLHANRVTGKERVRFHTRSERCLDVLSLYCVDGMIEVDLGVDGAEPEIPTATSAKGEKPEVGVTPAMMAAGSEVLACSGLFDVERPLLFPSLAKDVFMAMRAALDSADQVQMRAKT